MLDLGPIEARLDAARPRYLRVRLGPSLQMPVRDMAERDLFINAAGDLQALVAEVRSLRGVLDRVRVIASGHHAQQESPVLLHALTVDIPEMIDAVLTPTPSGPRP